MKIQVYQIRIQFKLKESIHAEDIQSTIAGFFDRVLATSSETLTFHNTNDYKNYTFDGFHPYEVEKNYFADKTYTTTLRTNDSNLAVFFEKQLCKVETTSLQVINTEKRIIPKKQIEKIYSITPIILKCEDGRYWKNSMNLDEFSERLKENLIKKYNLLTNSKMDEHFQLFKSITFKNKVPIATKYKNIKLLGDKIEVEVDESEQAQTLIYLALGSGLGEMNSRGFGFINFRYL